MVDDLEREGPGDRPACQADAWVEALPAFGDEVARVIEGATAFLLPLQLTPGETVNLRRPRS